MNAVIVYASQTGFTKKYADWLAESLGAEALELNAAKAKEDTFFDKYDAVIFGGWANMGKVTGASWLLSRMDKWKAKKLAVFCVGASPADGPHVDEMIDKIFTQEQSKFARAFYCPGGLNYEKLSFGGKIAMKAFAAMMKKKKAETEAEKFMSESLSKSFDIADKKYLEPIISYIKN